MQIVRNSSPLPGRQRRGTKIANDADDEARPVAQTFFRTMTGLTRTDAPVEIIPAFLIPPYPPNMRRASSYFLRVVLGSE
jgi:hypothetical protein